MSALPLNPDILPGLCQCGCGSPTTQLKHDDPVRDLKAGEFARFAPQHYHIWMRQQNPEWGRKAQRTRLLEEIAPLAGKVDVRHHFSCPEAYTNFLKFRTGGVGAVSQWAREKAPLIEAREKQRLQEAIKARGIHELEEFWPRKPKPKPVPIYERPEIPYERETELPFLVNQPHVVLLDKEVDDGPAYYDTMSGSGMNPLEALMWKEEQEERRISEYAETLDVFRTVHEMGSIELTHMLDITHGSAMMRLTRLTECGLLKRSGARGAYVYRSASK